MIYVKNMVLCHFENWIQKLPTCPNNYIGINLTFIVSFLITFGGILDLTKGLPTRSPKHTGKLFFSIFQG
jgi:hypothetical protein